MAERRPIITLLTDFGEADYFVAAMKGAIYCLNRDVEIIDLTHQITPHDVFSGAFNLLCCYREFPKWTIHVAVVDPGVGSSRRPIFVMTDEYYFIGPDNGIFSYIYQRENINRVVHLTESHYFRAEVSNTFHGRDVFAPIAAYVAKQVDWTKMGAEISDYVKFNLPTPAVVSAKQLRGHVIQVDRFGNIITNITSAELPPERAAQGMRLRIGKHEAARCLKNFSEAANNELFAYFGSAGFLELAVARQNAARLVEARRGMEIEIALP
ncbi:MAG: SAM-dependent chlorinase/fluorinase [Acidobacteria bacterium]|nr:SAM-dependent chlorinase/fluorinase [Acidobacteriota bacterium]